MPRQPRTLVLLYPGCIAYEIHLAAELLSGKFPVLVATPDAEDHTTSSGMRLRADASYSDIAAQAVGDYRAILIPGGDPGSIMSNSSIDRLLITAAARQPDPPILAAICAGPLLLAKAGLLKGRRFTHGYGDHERDFLAPYWTDAIYEDRPLVWDDTILTAKPWAHVAFATSLAAMCGALPPGRTEEQVRAYYEGRP